MCSLFIVFMAWHEPAVAVDLGVLVQVVAILADALQLCEDALRINRERSCYNLLLY